MKRAALFLCLALAMPLGCKTVTTNVPPPPGAVNPSDAQVNAILQAAHASEVQYNSDVAAGFVPSAALKSIMSKLTTSLNIADPLYQEWHAALLTAPQTAEPAALVTETAQVQTALSQISVNGGN